MSRLSSPAQRPCGGHHRDARPPGEQQLRAGQARVTTSRTTSRGSSSRKAAACLASRSASRSGGEYEYGPLGCARHGIHRFSHGRRARRAFGDLGYLNDDQIGKTGVEATFEEILRGTYGEQEVEQDALGRILRTIEVTREPIPGNSIELTIDVEIQREAEEALKWATDIVNLQRGVVIVMNPQTGEILAIVSLPTYDNNLFARGISNADYQALHRGPESTRW